MPSRGLTRRRRSAHRFQREESRASKLRVLEGRPTPPTILRVGSPKRPPACTFINVVCDVMNVSCGYASYLRVRSYARVAGNADDLPVFAERVHQPALAAARNFGPGVENNMYPPPPPPPPPNHTHTRARARAHTHRRHPHAHKAESPRGYDEGYSGTLGYSTGFKTIAYT